MSNEYLTPAFRMRGLAPACKFVLVALADLADGQGLCYPSVAHLVQMTSLNRKTVLRALAKLRRCGIIQNTGDFRGKTQQIPILKLLYQATGPKSGTVSKQTVPLLPGTGPTFDPKQALKWDTEPLEPSLEPKGFNLDLKKRLLFAGFSQKELGYVSDVEVDGQTGTYVFLCKSKWIAAQLDQQCSYKLTKALGNWKIVLAVA